MSEDHRSIELEVEVPGTPEEVHLQHFGGRTATAMLPMASWGGPRHQAWTRLLDELGLPPRSAVGERVEISTADAPPLAGTVADAAAHRLALVVDEPAPGTAFVVVEGEGETVTVSIWAYPYGEDASAVAERDRVRWQAWLDQRSVPAE
jgi:hypothetical protein